MRKVIVRPATVLLGLAVLAMLSCAGCGGLTKVSSGSSCSWIHSAATSSNTPDTTTAASNTVVLMDTSASYWPAKGVSKDLPDSPSQAALNTLVSNFDQGGTRLVSLGVFDGSSTTVRWLLADASLPSATGTAELVSDEQQNASHCLASQVASAERTAPELPGTDVMGALSAAGTELGQTSAAHSHVLLITDGLSNTGCLNFNEILRQGETASDVVGSCSQQDGLSRLSGVDLKLVGIGDQALYQPMPSSEQDWMENYWRDLCSVLKVASPQACVAPQTVQSVRLSNVNRPTDAPITFPVVAQAPEIVVPAPLLFAFNSATLSATAQSYLNILIQQIRNDGRTITKVVGHTDRIGSAAYNFVLSQRRAAAVQSYFTSRGFKGITATGVGFSQPACPNDYNPDGQLNKACMTKDRRVEIFLGGQK